MQVGGRTAIAIGESQAMVVCSAGGIVSQPRHRIN